MIRSTILLNKPRNVQPEYVRALVQKIGLPITELADALDIHQRTFNRYLQQSAASSATPIPHVVLVLLELLADGSLKLS